jgi:quercetin dioxygenase-like cupin family protein
MTFAISQAKSDISPDVRTGIHVPSGGGVTKWFSGDVYSVKLTAQQTNGAVGVVEASVPPGGGPVAHTHADQDETFYVISGELEFLDGERTFMAGPGNLVHCPRRTRHRFLAPDSVTGSGGAAKGHLHRRPLTGHPRLVTAAAQAILLHGHALRPYRLVQPCSSPDNRCSSSAMSATNQI